MNCHRVTQLKNSASFVLCEPPGQTAGILITSSRPSVITVGCWLQTNICLAGLSMERQRETKLPLFIGIDCDNWENGERSHHSFLAIIHIKEQRGWLYTDLAGYPLFIFFLSLYATSNIKIKLRRTPVDADIRGWKAFGKKYIPHGLEIGPCSLSTGEKGSLSWIWQVPL